MKQIIFITLISFYSISFYCQNSFEKGYFINNSNERVECYIEHLDLLYNPNSIIYKVSLNGKKNTATIENVKEFEIYKISKYERHTVKMDRSSENYKELSLTRKVKFTDEQLFLKVLVKGKASLYKYAEPGLLRFFYEIDDIKQLVFKSYLSKDRFTIKKNEMYKQQILDDLKCNDIKVNQIKKLQYRSSNLTNMFIDYNNCNKSDFINYTNKNKENSKSHFNLSLKTAANFLNFSILDISFDNKLTLQLGVESEFIMGFNNNKWSFVAEANYINYSSIYNDLTERITDANNSANINYSAIDVPIGFRHYRYINNKSKVFVNAFLIPNFTLKSKIRSINDVVNIRLDYDIKPDVNFAIGMGYKYNNKLSVEFRINTVRDLLNQFSTIESSFSSTSIVFGYTIF